MTALELAARVFILGTVAGRDRSPNFPALPIEASLALCASVLHHLEARGQSPSDKVPLTEVARLLGHATPQSGAFSTKLAAMRAYGFVHAARGSLTLTSDVVRWCQGTMTAEQRMGFVAGLVLLPAVHEEVVVAFAEGGSGWFKRPMPPEANEFLIEKLRFSPKAARACLSVLNQNLRFLARVDDPTNSADTEPMATPPAAHAPVEYRWELGAGVRATLVFSAPPAERNIDLLRRYIDLLEEALRAGGGAA